MVASDEEDQGGDDERGGGNEANHDIGIYSDVGGGVSQRYL